MVPGPEPGHQRHAAVPRPFHHVLVGWDGSADSLAALKTAVAIVGGEGGLVTAFAVLPAQPQVEAVADAGDDAAPGHQVRAAFEAARTAITAATPARLTLQTTVDRHVARALCDYAGEHGSDLLVLGRHGDGGVLHPRLGHVAETAAKTSTIPVLLVSAR